MHFSEKRFARGGFLVRLALLAAATLWPVATYGQDQQDELPQPETVVIPTGDGARLQATYYAAPEKFGKKAAAVILLHASGGNRRDFEKLAGQLQRVGCAVIAPDLRGHGDSTPIDRALSLDDYAAMVRFDLEAVKGFLLARHNAGELNIDRLGVAGLEMGAALAVNWAALDWNWPVLATGKQGQDVKALALVSPEWSYEGLKIAEAMARPDIRSRVAFLIVTGRRNSKLMREAKRLHNALAKYQAASADNVEDQTLFLQTPATSLQGTQLLHEKSLKVEPMIAEFFEMRLVKPAYPWRVRKNPLQQ